MRGPTLIVGVRERDQKVIADSVTIEGLDPVACCMLAVGEVMGRARGRFPLTEAREFAPRLMGPGVMRTARDSILLTHRGLVEALGVLDELVELAFAGADVAHDALVSLAPSALLNEAAMVAPVADSGEGQSEQEADAEHAADPE